MNIYMKAETLAYLVNQDPNLILQVLTGEEIDEFIERAHEGETVNNTPQAISAEIMRIANEQ